MTKTFRHQFVEFIPEVLDEGVLYISVKYETISHKCYCGCGREVVTPLSPTFWRMTFDGETVTLYPSIGNWNFPCRSHYWIERSRVRWAPAWTDIEVADARREDDEMRARYYSRSLDGPDPRSSNRSEEDDDDAP